MHFLFYTHSLVSDWNHGNAHFLRGVMRNLHERGDSALALEPAGGWSRDNLAKDQGVAVEARFFRAFPTLRSETYDADFDHEAALAEADVVIVHEWTDPALIARIGRARANGGTFTLLFHDTHHRAVSQEGEIAEMRLADYDGILAFGETLRQRYLKAGWGRTVFTWHEAADTPLFRPLPEVEKTGELIWIGNWGDGERTRELQTFLMEPARRLGLDATVRGVRYPKEALAELERAGIHYGGWIANADVPAAFAAHRATVHVPRRPYVEALPGIPTIRVFEALACGIPLVSAPWRDEEALFRPGRDFLFAENGEEMARHLRAILSDPDLANSLARSGLETILSRHTCAHRVDQLFEILSEIGTDRVRRQIATQEAAQ
ncbi:CgeB family protein [Consotaella salsifontis]|uniref:Spore maturation protein CgeB n=1 Tax=Consotaella salsifontis TaxID=1365950 RepID=A0A1T4PPV6_9HYPH|nr:glycosyltransferase [Consotaella salsifontis]SJZ93610.1 Spore maturation protein CgeB [Consotaella salsifontis]